MSINIITSQDIFAQGTTSPYNKVGSLSVDVWGNRYRYVKVGGSALVAGNLLQEPAEDTQFVSMAVPAIVAIGATSITVTNGTTAVVANDHKDGLLTISTSTGIGQSFHITGNTAGVSGAAVTYNLDRPLLVALVTSSKVSVRANPYDGVIQYPVTTQTGGAVGFARIANTLGTYGYIQSGGDTPVLFDTGTNTGNGTSGIAPSAAVAGSVAPVLDAVGAITLGFSRQIASVDSTVSIAHISID